MIRFTLLPKLAGLSLVLAGLWIVFIVKKRYLATFLGIALALFFLIGHLPDRLRYHPELLGVWTDAIKLLALAGGAFMVAEQSQERNDMPFLEA